MARLLVAVVGWVTRHVLMLVLIVAVLVAGTVVLGQWRALAVADGQAGDLAGSAEAIVQSGVAARQRLDARLPKDQQPASWQQLADGLDRDIQLKHQARGQLQKQHPLQSRVPGSDAYQQLKILELQIGLLEQGRAYAGAVLATLRGVLAGEEAARQEVAACEREAAAAGQRLYENRRQQWQLSQDAPWAWQVPGLAAYRQMKALEQSQTQLGAEAATAQQRCEVLKLVVREKARVAAFVAPFDPSTNPADRAVRELADERERLQARQQDSWLHQAMATARQVLPVAAGILLAAIALPIGIKLLFYFVLAPLAARRPAICILPARQGGTWAAPGARISAVSQSLVLQPGEELLVHPNYLQSAPLAAAKSTRWLLDWTMPFTSMAAGLYALTRVLPHGAQPLVVSSTTDPLSEVGVLDLPAGAALVLQPRNLVGLVKRRGQPLRITRHWMLGHLHAWLTLQLRYVVFHGPCRLLVKGCRGVRVEPPDAGRAVNQDLTVGFSAHLHYATTRCETFAAYWLGRQALFNDRFSGESGVCVYEEMVSPQRRTGIAGRWLEGAGDAVLKAFGV
jgi:hypothetical protein